MRSNAVGAIQSSASRKCSHGALARRIAAFRAALTPPFACCTSRKRGSRARMLGHDLRRGIGRAIVDHDRFPARECLRGSESSATRIVRAALNAGTITEMRRRRLAARLWSGAAASMPAVPRAAYSPPASASRSASAVRSSCASVVASSRRRCPPCSRSAVGSGSIVPTGRPPSRTRIASGRLRSSSDSARSSPASRSIDNQRDAFHHRAHPSPVAAMRDASESSLPTSAATPSQYDCTSVPPWSWRHWLRSRKRESQVRIGSAARVSQRAIPGARNALYRMKPASVRVGGRRHEMRR